MPGCGVALDEEVRAVASGDEHLLRGVAGLARRNHPSLRKIHPVHCGEVHVVAVDDDRHHVVGRSVEHSEPNYFAGAIVKRCTGSWVPLGSVSLPGV